MLKTHNLERTVGMDMGQLKSFLEVTRHRNFSRAGQALLLSQPAISRQIQRLEREIGAVLFDRRGNKIELTPAGAKFKTYAEDAISRYRVAIHTIQDRQVAIAGELRIAASTTPGEFLVPELVSRFAYRYPEVKPQIFITDSTQVITELKERNWDVGFVGVRLPDRNLQYHTVAEDEVVLAVPVGHPFAIRRQIRLEELEGQPFLEREGGSGTLQSVRASLARYSFTLPAYRVEMVLSSIQAILLAVERGYGIGWVSSLALGPGWAKHISLVRLEGMSLRRDLYLVVDSQRVLPAVAAYFANWVRQEQRTIAIVSPG
jgi:DNA-binding transcriptional LysR family regulator